MAAIPAWLASLKSSNAVNIAHEPSIAESYAKEVGKAANDIVIG